MGVFMMAIEIWDPCMDLENYFIQMVSLLMKVSGRTMPSMEKAKFTMKNLNRFILNLTIQTLINYKIIGNTMKVK